MYKERLTKVVKDGDDYITKDYIEQNRSKRLVKKRFRKAYDDLFKVYFYLVGSEPKVLSYIILNCNKVNILEITYKQLSNKLNLSVIRIKEIMKKLQQLNVVKNFNGTIYINPYMFVKSGNNAETLQIEYMVMFKEELHGKDI